MKFKLRKFAVAAALVLLSPLAGCPGGIDDPTGTGGTSGNTCVPANATSSPVPATFTAIKTMFNMGEGAVSSCVSAPCHGDNGFAPPAKPLSLQTGANLYNTMMTYKSDGCGGIPLVNKGKPNESALFKMLSPGACGNAQLRMPLDCVDEQCMPTDYMNAISAWISNCAPEN